MAFSIPKEIVFAREQTNFQVFKQPLTSGTVGHSIECSDILEAIPDQQDHGKEYLVVPNEEFWGPISVSHIFSENIVFKLPFQWQDGTPVLWAVSIAKASTLCSNGSLDNQRFKVINVQNRYLTIVPESAFGVKEFIAQKAADDHLTMKMLTPADYGKVFQHKRNASKETCIYYHVNGEPHWIGNVQSRKEWRVCPVEFTGLSLLHESCEILMAMRQAPEIKGAIHKLHYSEFLNKVPLFQEAELSTVLKVVNSVSFHLLSAALESTIADCLFKGDTPKAPVKLTEILENSIFKWSDPENNNVSEHRLRTAYPNAVLVPYISISKYRSRYTATLKCKMPWGIIRKSEELSFKTIAELHNAIGKWCEEKAIKIAVGTHAGVIRPVVYRADTYAHTHVKWE